MAVTGVQVCVCSSVQVCVPLPLLQVLAVAVQAEQLVGPEVQLGGVGVAVGFGVAVGTGVAVGAAFGVGVGALNIVGVGGGGVAVGPGFGVAVGTGLGVAVGTGLEVGGIEVGVGVHTVLYGGPMVHTC